MPSVRPIIQQKIPFHADKIKSATCAALFCRLIGEIWAGKSGLVFDPVSRLALDDTGRFAATITQII